MTTFISELTYSGHSKVPNKPFGCAPTTSLNFLQNETIRTSVFFEPSGVTFVCNRVSGKVSISCKVNFDKW